MSARTIHVVGAKGGQGTSTAGALIALEEQEAGNAVTLVDRNGDQGDLRAILGLASGYNDEPIKFVAPAGAPSVLVIDHGAGPFGTTGVVSVPADETVYLVIRPSFLALRRAMALGIRPTGAILMTEPDRSLGRRDVEDCLGVKVVAEIEVTSATARYIDAGILSSTRRRPRLNLAVSA